MRDRAIGIGLITLLAAALNPQNLGIIIMLGLIAILLESRWQPAPSQPGDPAKKATDKRVSAPSAKSEG